MKEVIVVCLILMDPRKKKLSTRYHENDEETQMELSWSCGEKNRQLWDNPHLITSWTRGHHGDTYTMGTDEDQGRDGGTTSIDRLAKHWHRPVEVNEE